MLPSDQRPDREPSPGPRVRAPDLLLISDLHLGSHLKPRMRGEYVHLAVDIDRGLPRFLDHYAGGPGRWQLVINGDFIDFWNIEVGQEKKLVGEALAVHRLHAVLDAYPGVEDALVRFLAAGHNIVFVVGNHDAEFLYPGVRRALTARLYAGLGEASLTITHTGSPRLDQVARVRFVPWFLCEAGGVWIEHGHVFDAACHTGQMLAPTRGGRLVQSLAEVATRSFTNAMPEIDYDAADKFITPWDYIRWAWARGLRFILYAITLYFRMAFRLLALWARTGRVDRAGQEMHAARLERIAATAGLQMSTLTALQSMAPPPASATVAGVLRITALDAILSVLACLGIGVGLAAALGAPLLAGLVAGALLGWLSIRRLRKRRRPRAVADDMARVACEVGRATGVPLVLMGHSHYGVIARGDEVVYANSGCFLDGSHLVVRRDPATGRLAEVELRAWRNDAVAVLDGARLPPAPPAPPHDEVVADRSLSDMPVATGP
ncbi:metallophosphoesterase [Nannocystis pusilla]|uniref:Metallophosphoesterase n=1 Tax=Nannocystis pusilla TaxID=889268 RepID=A0ABS7TPX9_9BACT|nr:metallophosphoesterase [Nannocystis pusilla]MBZ5710245.1 metallophosphoesterase [Nannocystis pusilla]